jgi:hypothetical protein
MGRAFTQLRLTRDICIGLREAIRPFGESAYLPHGTVREFCIRLYRAHYLLEADSDLEAIDFPLDRDEVLVINNFVSVEDGDWAKDVLHQTRQALYELDTGREAVRLASAEEVERMFESVTLDPDKGPEEPSVIDALEAIDSATKDEADA